MRFLPGILKELTKHVPTVLFNSVEWSELASELPRISRRLLQREGYETLFDFQKKFLHSYPLELTSRASNASKISSSQEAGDTLLRLYFAQLYSPSGLFLDLRSHHFSQQENHLIWEPSALWTKFDEDFRTGLLNVYEGFYLEDEKKYFLGLEALGLLKKEFLPEEKKELGDLFRKHFGMALDSKLAFKVTQLKDSIIQMSDFFLRKKVTISKDFLYLGIYLVTLYSTLEEWNQEHPVKEIYLSVRQKHLQDQPT